MTTVIYISVSVFYSVTNLHSAGSSVLVNWLCFTICLFICLSYVIKSIKVAEVLILDPTPRVDSWDTQLFNYMSLWGVRQTTCVQTYICTVGLAARSSAFSLKKDTTHPAHLAFNSFYVWSNYPRRTLCKCVSEVTSGCLNSVHCKKTSHLYLELILSITLLSSWLLVTVWMWTL